MSVNSKSMVYFNLKEVQHCVGEIYTEIDSKSAVSCLLDGIIPFYTSYAPYTIVSDIAANIEKFSEEEFSDRELTKPIDLSPTHVIDRVIKSKFLSEARTAFGLGFFTNNELVKSVDDPDYATYDGEYTGLKQLSRRGYDSLARYISFRYSQGLISLDAINRIANYICYTAKKMDLSTLAMLIVLAMNNTKKSEFSSIARRVNSGVRKAYLDAREPGKLSYTDEDTSKGVINGIVLLEAITVFMASDSSQEKKTSFNSNTILANFMEDLIYVGDEAKLKGIAQFYGDGYKPSDFNEIVDDIADILELE